MQLCRPGSKFSSPRLARILSASSFVLAASLLLPLSHWAQSPSSSPAPSSRPDDAALREQGKQVFAAHCGQCHDADASKKLADGTTLLSRLAARKDPQAKLATRLKSMSDQDGRGVALYMDDLIARFRASQKSLPEK